MGWSGGDFEITEERLGVYRPVRFPLIARDPSEIFDITRETEHIDNPRGYGGGKDPRDVDPRLRPPTSTEELDINRETGTKNYISKEGQGWDTSTANIKRLIRNSVMSARGYLESGNWELRNDAYRYLGSAVCSICSRFFSAECPFTASYTRSLGFLYTVEAEVLIAPLTRTSSLIPTG